MRARDDLGTPVAREHELLLRAALWSGDEAADAFARWRSVVDIEAIDPPSHRLLPLVAPRISDLAPDDPVRPLIQGVYRHAWAKNHRLWRAADPVLGALRARRIPTLLLKGVALLQAYGDHWGARPMYDVDVLVPAQRAAESVDVLASLGWEPEQEMSASWVRWRALPGHHSWGFVRGHGRLDLHWHVLPDSIGARADDQFWLRARPLVVGGSDEQALDPADLLVHVLLHGNTALNRPLLQWIADAVMVVRAFGSEDMYERFAATVRAHGEVATSTRALERIGSVLGPDLVAPPLARLRGVRPGMVDLLRRTGERAEPVRQLARHTAGGGGLLRGAAGLLDERLDLALTTRPAAVVTYAACLRSSRVARAWRGRGGSFVRTGIEPCAVASGDTLDFSLPTTLDHHGSVGWGRPERGGSTTKGGEARLVLPLGPSFDGADVVVTLELEARGRDSEISIRANETLVDVATVPVTGTTVRFSVPAALAARYVPLEIVLLNAARRVGRSSSVRLRLRRLTIERRPTR